MFDCSWQQIKNIIANRDAIMKFYEAKTNAKETSMGIEQRKIRFLNECVYESIQRINYHKKIPITEDLIRRKALEFHDYIQLEDFQPNKKWLIAFKSSYDISLSNKNLVLNRVPPVSINLKDVMAYCKKSFENPNANDAHMEVLRQKYSSSDEEIVEFEIRRARKLHFLRRVLKEYLHRAKFHYKSMTLDDDALQKVALEFADILKQHDFYPTLSWIKEFRQRHSVQYNSMVNSKQPLLSLDLKDIISYCSRMDNSKARTVTLKPKKYPHDDAEQLQHQLPKFPHVPADSRIKLKQSHIIYLDEEEEENVVQKKKAPESSFPLKIRKIESINNDSLLQHELNQETSAETLEMESKAIINNEEITIIVELEETEEAPHKSVITSTGSLLTQPTTSEIQLTIPSTKVSPTNTDTITLKSPHHDEDSALPRQINNFKDVLRLLKPLEEYAMLRENYRAIGLITQLEEVLRNSEDSHPEEDFT
ncbi:uncharacterized protein isoform X2 [Musca autumnalis]